MVATPLGELIQAQPQSRHYPAKAESYTLTVVFVTNVSKLTCLCRLDICPGCLCFPLLCTGGIHVCSGGRHAPALLHSLQSYPLL